MLKNLFKALGLTKRQAKRKLSKKAPKRKTLKKMKNKKVKKMRGG